MGRELPQALRRKVAVRNLGRAVGRNARPQIRQLPRGKLNAGQTREPTNESEAAET